MLVLLPLIAVLPPILLMFADVQAATEAPTTVVRLPRTWRFRRDPDREGMAKGFHLDSFDDAAWESIDIRRYWNHDTAPADQVHAWYRARFDAPSSFAGRPVTLFIQTLGGDADIYLNGEQVGTHYENDLKFDPPMELDATGPIRPGEPNVIAIHVRKQRYEKLNHLAGLSGDVLLYLAAAADDVFAKATPDYSPEFTYEDGRIFDRGRVIAQLDAKRLRLNRFFGRPDPPSRASGSIRPTRAH